MARDEQALARATQMFLDVVPSDPNAGPDVFRANFETMCEAFPLPGDARVEPVDADGVPCLLVSAPGADPERLIVFVHSGGGVIGSAQAYRSFGYDLSNAAEARVLLIDYRLAPENAYPAALEDVVTALRWAARTTAAPARTVLAGDSAGGGFAASALLVLKDQDDELPSGVALISPWVDWTNTAASLTSLVGIDPIVSKDMTDNMRAACLQGGEDPADWRISALHGGLSGLPPFWITVGTRDSLQDDSKSLAERITAAGGKAELHLVEDMIHVYPLFGSFLPEGQDAVERIGRFTIGQTTTMPARA
jgi:monoterpene epsilon-lactone hydrolase